MKVKTGLMVSALCVLVHMAGSGGAQVADPATGELFYEVQNVLTDPLPATVVLYQPDGTEEAAAGSETGRGTLAVPSGKYDLFVYVYYEGVPFLVDTQSIEIKPDEITPVLVSVKEGIASLGLDRFDQDWDGALDRVELDAGTDAKNPASYPGAIPFPQNDQVLKSEEGWYKGDLNCQSTYSGGDLTVKQLVNEAKDRDLDFLAITDARTMQHCLDEGYKSDDVLLIPAYQWGEDGNAAVLAPRTFVKHWENDPQAWFAIRQIGVQGGLFIVQHPCGPRSPWEWNVWGFHGVEVWQSTWRRWPSSSSDIFGKGRYTRGRTVIPNEMASALVAGVGTVNAQALKFAEQFWRERQDVRPALRVIAVGGSGRRLKTDGPLGEPTTFVYAQELSVRGIIEGLRAGRSFVAESPEGPNVLLVADADANGKFDALLGSVLPLNSEIRFRAVVEGALKRGRDIKIQVIKNGLPLLVLTPKDDPFHLDFEDTPIKRSWYRVDVIEIVNDEKAQAGYGTQRMLATTSPIYAQGPESTGVSQGITFERVKTERSGEVVHVMKPPQDIQRPPIQPQ